MHDLHDLMMVDTRMSAEESLSFSLFLTTPGIVAAIFSLVTTNSRALPFPFTFNTARSGNTAIEVKKFDHDNLNS